MSGSAETGGWRRRAGLAATVGGPALGLVGLVSVGVYVAGVLEVLGEPDRSWIFWGLIFLIGGLLLLKIGITVFVIGRRLIKPADADPASRD